MVNNALLTLDGYRSSPESPACLQSLCLPASSGQQRHELGILAQLKATSTARGAYISGCGRGHASRVQQGAGICFSLWPGSSAPEALRPESPAAWTFTTAVECIQESVQTVAPRLAAAERLLRHAAAAGSGATLCMAP